jgi:large subunit ribosomal protein L32
MPQEPKKKHSKARQGKRRASIRLSIPNAVICPNCGNMNLPHTVCRNCGFYRGREVVGRKNTKEEIK